MPENIGDTITYNGQLYAVTNRETEYTLGEAPRTTLHLEPVQETLRTGDTDGDTAPILQTGREIWTDYTNINDAIWRPVIDYALTDEFKKTLKPFIQQIIKETFEQEGFIVGRLPKEGESA